MNAAHAKSRFNIFVFFPNDAAITLNILEFVCENCFHNLNNSRFRKYLSSICPVHYTKILHSIFGLKKEQFLFLMRLQNRTNIYILPKFSSVEQYISAIIKIWLKVIYWLWRWTYTLVCIKMWSMIIVQAFQCLWK